ncbi:hypothetical protein AVEN_136683-1 [Araneus ventricosus]|uniref:Uncharacterized protein n=1 Tax=Araneus ventricosus TaxID=182803 RepID=A0A4Y2J388_ARAVE|nr:hypothetical protein AVEN_136683-1 [Araneus ventricosus]
MGLRDVKLDIHERSIPHLLVHFSPHRPHFQTFHLGGLFMDTPCKPHNRPLQFPRATVPPTPSAFKTGHPAPLSRETFTPPLPFCGFRFCERASLPFSRVVFQFYDRMH